MSSGTAAIVSNGQTLPAPVGAEVFESDVLRTGPDGRLAVMLRDETRVALGPGQRSGARRLRLRAVRVPVSASRCAWCAASISYVSGLVAKLAPEAVTIQTPTAIIGVRGTHALVRVDAP